MQFTVASMRDENFHCALLWTDVATWLPVCGDHRSSVTSLTLISKNDQLPYTRRFR